MTRATPLRLAAGLATWLTTTLIASQPTLAEAPPPQFQLEGSELKLPSPVRFETASDKLRPESEAALRHVAAYLNSKSYISLLRVEGHSDNQGSPAALQTLTEQRALSVSRWLVAHGIDCKRLLPVGFGSSKPIAPSDSADGRAQNQRVAFVNAALRGHAIGGLPVEGGGRVAGDPCK